MAPPGFTLDNTAQAVLGLKEGGEEALRLDVVSVPAEQSLPDYLKSGWMENVDPVSVEEFSVNGFPDRNRNIRRRQLVVPHLRRTFRQRRLSFYFRCQEQDRQVDRTFREFIMTFRRMTLKESQQVKSLRLKVVTVGQTIRSKSSHTEWRRPITRSTVSAYSMARPA